MALGRQGERQADLMIGWAEQPRSPGHAFYDRLQAVLVKAGFDRFAESECAPYYASRRGRPSLPPGRYFRMHLVRPYVRPVARPTPLAIMGVRSRARHQSQRRARGAAKSTVSPGLSRPQPFPSRRSALPAGPAGLASAASRAPERYAATSAAAAARPFAR